MPNNFSAEDSNASSHYLPAIKDLLKALAISESTIVIGNKDSAKLGYRTLMIRNEVMQE